MPYEITTGALPDAARLAPGLYHACLSDAPYELGFMNQDWDRSGVAFRPDTWAAVMDRLYSGAFGMTFGGSRTYHRIACAIEDAGAIIHPTIFMWVFASGFPKATRIDTQIDKARGNERLVIGEKDTFKGINTQGNVDFVSGSQHRIISITKSIDDDVNRWEGHRYGLQAMRPAVEPIILWQKPYPKREKPFEAMVRTGAGSLNINGCLIPRSDDSDLNGGAYRGMPGLRDPSSYMLGNTGKEFVQRDGGWPSNLIVLHRPDCADQCSPECPVPGLILQDPEAAQHFHIFDWSLDLEDQLGNGSPAFYSGKAKGLERDEGIEGPVTTMDDGREKSIDNPYLRGETTRKNTHPTVKPLILCQHLAKLLLPPQGYDRRLLVPFSGSGSEMIGGHLAGWEYIHGIELRKEAVDTARQRLAWWVNRAKEAQTTAPKEILKSEAPKTGGRTLFDVQKERSRK